jgi:HEPN domain-containing protein
MLNKITTTILYTEAPEAIFILAHKAVNYSCDNIFFNVTQTAKQPSAYLLLLVTDTDSKTCTQMQSKLEDILQPFADITCWCIPLGVFNEQSSKGDHFVANVFNNAERPYIAEDADLVTPQKINSLPYQSQWYRRALEFYAGAELYIIRKQYAIAAFQLHQCAEQAFTGIVYNNCGYRPSTHNLLLLYKYACWFEPLLHQLFTKNEESALHLLQDAYAGSRYTNEYTIKGKQLELLKEKMQQLLDTSKMVATSVSGKQ